MRATNELTQFPTLVTLFGIPYANITQTAALNWIEEAIRKRIPRMVCTPNVDHVMLARSDAEFMQILLDADLNVADGMGIVYASRLVGKPLPENIGGRLLLNEIAQRAAKEGHRIFLMGGRSQEDAERAGRTLEAANPGLKIAGILAPPIAAEFSVAVDTRIVELVRQSKPDILFVGIGTPKQEKW